MTQTLLGILIGLLTSILAGVFLIWKGEQLVQHLKKLPTKRRVDLLTSACKIALHSYPYRYTNLIVMALVATLQIVLLFLYTITTYVLFSLPIDQTPRGFIFKAIHGTLEQNKPALPWLALIITISLAYVTWRFVFRVIPLELLVPYAHRELSRLRECVEKCATKKEFIEYTNAEYKVVSGKDLKALITSAKNIIGDIKFDLADELLAGLSEDIPIEVPNNVDESKKTTA